MASAQSTADASVFIQQRPEVSGQNEAVTFLVDDSQQFGRFEEKFGYLLDKFEYSRKGKEPGLLIIFNQVHFNSQSSSVRRGSCRDVNEIILCFSRLGFNIESKYIFTDLTKAEIFESINSVLNENLKEINSVVVFFLTHGSNKNTLMAKDKTFNGASIWKQFSAHNDLKNKPKLFVIQACKGILHNNATDKAKAFLVPHTTFSVDSIPSDMVIVFSSVEGSASFRNGITGSWFIQELCKNFSNYGRRDDVLTLLLRTNKCVARNYVTEDGAQEMPVFISTLNKMFYLNRNKERSSLLEFNQNNDKVLNLLS
ncbi:hypothetical protein WA026_018906 [Henosepilachna vigintioctopunctata]|uniref:Caspase-3 n=1 Tax=Henosepilachna vigintioctopunctata TaxID=420089 RepID=A0AAW1UEG8_9CUCU